MSNKLKLLLLILLILLSVFLRSYKIRDYVVFLGDEGRDMMVMRNMVLEKKPTFLGPTASVGGFYLGPIYYWMATPFLVLSRFDPVGPSLMVAGFGVATVFLLFKFLFQTVGFGPAFLAALLYSASPLIVRYSRSSWNPNPLPFFSLLLIYFLYLGLKKKKWFYFSAAGLSFGIAIQLHYLAINLIPIAFLIIALNSKIRRIPQIAVAAIAGAVITFSPFLLFEIKHSFPNFQTIFEFVTRKSTHGLKTANLFWIVSNFGNILLEDLTKLKSTPITKIIFWFLALGGTYGFFKNFKDTQKKLIFSIAVVWFIGGLIFLRYYSGQIYDYYFGFMFPAPFFLMGAIFSLFWQKTLIRISLIFISLVTFVYFLTNGFYNQPPNRLIDQTEKVADVVIEKSENKTFNFALITDHNSDHAYRYFLEIKNHEPVELETLITDQLIVVCESKKCSPLGHPIWEIAGFGRAEIEGEWELQDIGIKIFRLVHWTGAPSPAGRPAVKGN